MFDSSGAILLQSFPITPCGAGRTIGALSIAKALYDVLGTVQSAVCLCALFAHSNKCSTFKACGLRKGGSTLVTLPRIVTPYRDSVDGTRDRVS